jgi:hypothetical protein
VINAPIWGTIFDIETFVVDSKSVLGHSIPISTNDPSTSSGGSQGIRWIYKLIFCIEFYGHVY